MKIVVNHLTRMKAPRVCVAGVDPETYSHVRPVSGGGLPSVVLSREGGPFAIGALVELGAATACGSPPEIEDCSVDLAKAVPEEVLSKKAFWELLKNVSLPSLKAIFGPELQLNGQTMAVDVGKGRASLGCWAPAGGTSLEVDSRYGKVYARVQEGDAQLRVAVTDIRLYKTDQKTPRMKRVDGLNFRLLAGVECILSVGLARAYKKTGDNVERHYLQVNNVHLEDDPLWQGE